MLSHNTPFSGTPFPHVPGSQQLSFSLKIPELKPDCHLAWVRNTHPTFNSYLNKVTRTETLVITVMSQALSYLICRSGLTVPDMKGFWTEASAHVLCQPSVVVQVFQVVCRYMCSPRTVGKSQSQRYHGNSFHARTSRKSRGSRGE